ncbi:hypothetical protein [Kaarinaea lacus]
MIYFVFLLAACDRSAQEENGNTDTSQQIIQPSFIAPEDNRLTELQVQLYLAVKNTEKELLDELQKELQTNPAAISATSYQDIEQRAVQLNRVSSDEYDWIKNTVINSRIQQQFQEYFALNEQIISLLEGTLHRHEATKKNLQDPEEIAMLDSHVKEINEHIQTLKNQIEKYTNLSESEKHNIEMVKNFSTQLEAIEKYQLSSQAKNQ